MLKLWNKRSFLRSSVAAAASESLWGGKSSLLTEAATNDFNLCRGFSTESGATATTEPKFQPNGESGNRIFAPYSIFKGKAALSAEPVLPKFAKLESGNMKVERRGVIMLTFRPAIGERKYDSEKRQRFALSATEVGSLISMGANASCDFFHDPGMLTSNAGQVRKSLSVKAHADGSGYFFSLSVVDNILKTNDRMVVPVTTAEFAVLKAAFAYALPHIMGWDQFTNQGNQIPSSQISPQPVGELVGLEEWDR